MKTAFCSLTYLFSFTRAELGLPADATDTEVENAAEERMNKIIEFIEENADIFHNDLEISVSNT
ncbi:MAG: hypothetical protein J6R90_06090 [Alistipes sp.]|nr:hypothetical protein [Alistipes sp.]